jgi:hypothetical protein
MYNNSEFCYYSSIVIKNTLPLDYSLDKVNKIRICHFILIYLSNPENLEGVKRVSLKCILRPFSKGILNGQSNANYGSPTNFITYLSNLFLTIILNLSRSETDLVWLSGLV